MSRPPSRLGHVCHRCGSDRTHSSFVASLSGDALTAGYQRYLSLRLSALPLQVIGNAHVSRYFPYSSENSLRRYYGVSCCGRSFTASGSGYWGTVASLLEALGRFLRTVWSTYRGTVYMTNIAVLQMTFHTNFFFSIFFIEILYI